MIGQTFGRLTILRLSHLDARHRKFYVCSCACGGEKIAQATLVKHGNTKSCGCLDREARQRGRLPNHASAITAIILGYQRHARNRGIEWSLTRAEVDATVRQPCHYCGEPAGNLKRVKGLPEGFPHNGIDRMNSSKSYRIGNVVACCGTCNIAKGKRSRAEFIAWAVRIAKEWE